MKRVLRNYLRWKNSHLRGIRIVQAEREYEKMRIVYTHKVGGIFSRNRERKIVTIDLWEMVQYLYFSANGRTD
jgi:hypothetical protein